MVIHNDGPALNPIPNLAPASSQPSGQQAQQPAPAIDHATLSAAGTGISQTTTDTDVRWEKVAAVQQALAGGTYNVPASAVASSIVDTMQGKRS